MTLKDALLSGLCPDIAATTSYTQQNSTLPVKISAAQHASPIDISTSALAAFITILGSVSTRFL
jgi:hypothetical protein